jgi:hypothetical protein
MNLIDTNLIDYENRLFGHTRSQHPLLTPRESMLHDICKMIISYENGCYSGLYAVTMNLRTLCDRTIIPLVAKTIK